MFEEVFLTVAKTLQDITNIYLVYLSTFRPPSNIVNLSVSNSTVIIALTNYVMRLNLVNTEEIDSKIK